MHDGDYVTAHRSYSTLLDRPLDDAMRARSLLGLGNAHLQNQEPEEATRALQRLVTDYAGTDAAHRGTFLLADALVASGEPLSATDAYSSYLAAGTVITPYVELSQGDALRAAGAYNAAVSPYERAIAAAPSRFFEADARERLASALTVREDYDAAVAQYEAILRIAQQPGYRAQIEYQAAETLRLGGDSQAAYERYANVVQTYPTEEPAYLSLVELVEAGRPVNDLLRGQVDYYGGAYGPAVQALYRYILAYPATHSGDAHWWAGLSYWEAGSLELAVNEFQLLIDTHPESDRWGAAWLELAELRADKDGTDAALETYRAFVDAAPSDSMVPEALWEAGQLSRRSGLIEAAADYYLECQSVDPDSGFAPSALFYAGLQLYELGDLAEAAEAWEALTDRYVDSPYRAAALLWLGKLYLSEGEVEAAAEALGAAAAAEPDQYYGLRAAQIASDSPATSALPHDDEARQITYDQDDAEAWLTSWLEVEEEEGLGRLSPDLSANPRLQRGMELWSVGRFREAKSELEALRAETYTSALDQYQLSLAYGELGLYRSSILCAQRVINLSPITKTLDAPGFVLRLAYPTYYENLVLENARRTGLEPHLIFSLIRQESLFESLATSSASAHGLMQVIPPTGAEIADELDWPPGYETSDLYLPYVSLRFGTYYLAKQRERFDGRTDVALAAYNGGPFNAQRWLEQAGGDRDLFLEQITFGETRLYVKRVQEHLAVYEALYAE